MTTIWCFSPCTQFTEVHFVLHLESKYFNWRDKENSNLYTRGRNMAILSRYQLTLFCSSRLYGCYWTGQPYSRKFDASPLTYGTTNQEVKKGKSLQQHISSQARKRLTIEMAKVAVVRTCLKKVLGNCFGEKKVDCDPEIYNLINASIIIRPPSVLQP